MDRPWIEAGLKRARIRESDLPALLVQRVTRLRGTESVQTSYLHHVLASRAFTDYIKPIVTGVTVPHISPDQIKSFGFQLPPISQQDAICGVLDAIDDLIENNRRRIALLERLAQAIYREWFVHFRYPGHENDELVDSPLGPIPAGWAACRTSQLIESGTLEIGDGYRAKNSEFSEAGVPFVRVGNVQGGSLQLEGSDLLPADYVSRVAGKASQSGDCLISMKGTVGRVAFVGEATPTVIYSPQISYWRSLDSSAVSPIYLRRWIQSDHFRVQCAQVKGATDMADYVNLKDQRRMELLLPREGVQRDFDTTVGPMHDLADLLGFQASALSDLRDRLLPKLVTGAIDVSHFDLDALLDGKASADYLSEGDN